MRIWVMSDLHLEVTDLPAPLPIADADLCVVAGDVLTGGIVPSLEWIADNILPAMPVVFVAGNHEFYDAAFVDSMIAANAFAQDLPGLHDLDGGTAEIGDVRFAGGSLWTDFELGGWQNAAMTEARQQMNDYRRITLSSHPARKFLPLHGMQKHFRDLGAIDHALAADRHGPLVVVSHHAPSERSLPTAERGTLMAAAYASDLSRTILSGRPDLWIHGHVHHRSDYMIGDTRILANPRGYPGEDTFENFDPTFVVDV